MTERLSASEWEFLRNISPEDINPGTVFYIATSMIPRLIAEYDALAEKLRVATDEGESYIVAYDLERFLFSDHLSDRDEAMKTIAHYADPANIPIVKKAIRREKCDWMREYMTEILAQLQETLALRTTGLPSTQIKSHRRNLA